jgi:four helix bundle protein
VDSEDASNGFRGLFVWQKAQAFALDVLQEISKSPKSANAGVMGTQLVRSAGSVPANIAEGYGRYSQGAYRNHLSIARGSLFESESWIDLMFKAAYLSPEASARLTGECHELARLLTERMRSLGKPPEQRIRDEEENYEV